MEKFINHQTVNHGEREYVNGKDSMLTVMKIGIYSFEDFLEYLEVFLNIIYQVIILLMTEQN
jgi:hypothetical protein